MRRRAQAYPIAIVVAIAAAIAVEAIFLGRSWFFLDDIRNLAQATHDGLSWSFLTEPIGEHLTPGHRFLDWVVAEPLGRSWTGASVVLLAWSALGLAYLAGTMRELFGANPWHAIPVFLAGTAWPLLGTAQWFAGAALAIPAAAALSAALFHHVRWRRGGRARNGVGAVAWIGVGLVFSIQTAFAPVFLFVVVVVCLPRFSIRAVGAEVLALVPIGLLALAWVLYVRAQPYAPVNHTPSLTDFVALTRTVAVRGTLPSLAGLGMDGAVPDPARESTMQAVAAILLAAGFVSAAISRNRWVVAAALMTSGVVLTSAIIAFGRLGVLTVTAAGTETRYLLPAVLMGSLGIAALMTRQPARPARAPASRGLRIALAIVTVGVAALYASNIRYTSDNRIFSVQEGAVAQLQTTALSRSIADTLAAGREASIVDTELPPPLFYPGESTNRLSAYERFFTSHELAAPGVPSGGRVLEVDPTGALVPRRFSPAAPARRCAAERRCVVRAGARAGTVVLVTLAPGGAAGWLSASGVPPAGLGRRVPVPAGARSAILRLQTAATAAPPVIEATGVRLQGVQPGVLVPAGG